MFTLIFRLEILCMFVGERILCKFGFGFFKILAFYFKIGFCSHLESGKVRSIPRNILWFQQSYRGDKADG